MQGHKGVEARGRPVGRRTWTLDDGVEKRTTGARLVELRGGRGGADRRRRREGAAMASGVVVPVGGDGRSGRRGLP